MKLRTAGYLLSEGVRAVRRHPALSASAIVSMAASLLVLALFLLIGVNVRRVMGDLEARKNVVVYLKTEATDEDRQRVEERLKEVPGVGGVRYVSAEEAWQEFTARMDTQELLDTVGENPLPASFELALAVDHRELSRIQALANEIGGWTEVEEVSFGSAWVANLDRLSRRLLWFNLIVGLVVGLAVIAVVANTIQLTVLAKSDMIHIMKTIGASETFIQVPFLLEGAIQSLAAGGLSLLILGGALRLLPDRFEGVHFFSAPQVLLYLGSGLALGLVGSFLALRRVLGQRGL